MEQPTPVAIQSLSTAENFVLQSLSSLGIAVAVLGMITFVLSVLIHHRTRLQKRTWALHLTRFVIVGVTAAVSGALASIAQQDLGSSIGSLVGIFLGGAVGGVISAVMDAIAHSLINSQVST